MNIETKITSRLLENVEIHPEDVCVKLIGELTSTNAIAISETLLDLDKLSLPAIPFLIHCEGGDVDGMVTIAQTMEQCRTPICTVNLGVAASAAACLFCLGSDGLRIMTPHSYLMFHEFSMAFADGKSCDIRAVQQQYAHIDEVMRKKIETHIGLKDGYFLKMGHVDTFVQSEAALRDKLATAVGYPTLKLKAAISGGVEVRTKRVCEDAAPYRYTKFCRMKAMPDVSDEF